MIEIKAPNKYDCDTIGMIMQYKIFLAGSIEMGLAEKWQEQAVNFLREKYLDKENVVILNPRRDDWDSSWEQKKTNPKFKQQVRWEQDAIHGADTVIFYFDPNTKSPVTLLELGQMVKKNKHAWQNIYVCCPEGYWRKGNVDIVCEDAGIPIYETLEEMLDKVVC